MKKLALLFIIVLTLFACRRNTVLEQNQWSEIFKKYQIDSACFELGDNSHDQIFIYNLKRASARFSPASTFKIMNSLVALETNIAPDENLIIPWDKKVRNREEWNKDMNMREAFKVSCLPYYQELARRIGAVEMQHWIDSVKYGNQRIGGAIDEFWLNDTMQITADEQVGLMKKLYFDKLPFSIRTQRIVRSLMLQEDTTDYRLYFKTGTQINNGKLLAWIVGFVERKETQIGILTKKSETNFKPYFFAMNFTTSDTAMDSRTVRINILHDILRERKIIK